MPSEIQWLVETHDNWTGGTDCRALVEAIRAPNVGILWDIAHPPRFNGEAVDKTFEIIGPLVRYTHIKDGRHEPQHPQAMSDGWRYVTPGTGEIQLRRAVQLLRKSGYQGYLTLEHEKRWHPELPGARRGAAGIRAVGPAGAKRLTRRSRAQR